MFAKIEEDKIIQTQPNQEDGFIEVPDEAVCGMMWDGITLTVPELIITPPTIQEQIITLERSVTPRRIREAILGTDNGWLADVEEQIEALRGNL